MLWLFLSYSMISSQCIFEFLFTPGIQQESELYRIQVLFLKLIKVAPFIQIPIGSWEVALDLDFRVHVTGVSGFDFECSDLVPSVYVSVTVEFVIFGFVVRQYRLDYYVGY